MADEISADKHAELEERYGSDYAEHVDRDGNGIITDTESRVHELLHELKRFDFDGNKYVELDEVEAVIRDHFNKLDETAREEALNNRGISTTELINQEVGIFAKFTPQKICELLNDPDVLTADKAELGEFVLQDLPDKPQQECGPLIS